MLMIKRNVLKNYQHETVHSFLELLAAAGLEKPEDITRKHINKRVGINKVMRFVDLYPEVEVGSLLAKETA